MAGRSGEEKDQQRAGRLRVEEEWLNGEAISEVQSRIQLDRLTSGVLPGALFDEKPVWGGGVEWRLGCKLDEPRDYEIGLLLQIIKDMWLGDLTIGGGTGIGRGVLHGLTARLFLQRNGAVTEWRFRQAGGKLVFETGTPESLNAFATILYEELTKND